MNIKQEQYKRILLFGVGVNIGLSLGSLIDLELLAFASNFLLASILFFVYKRND